MRFFKSVSDILFDLNKEINLIITDVNIDTFLKKFFFSKISMDKLLVVPNVKGYLKKFESIQCIGYVIATDDSLPHLVWRLHFFHFKLNHI